MSLSHWRCDPDRFPGHRRRRRRQADTAASDHRSRVEDGRLHAAGAAGRDRRHRTAERAAARSSRCRAGATATNAGSILFAVPEGTAAGRATARLSRTGATAACGRGYSVASPGFDAKTRTLSSTHKARGCGDCGTIQELKWTGWHFRLLNVWSKEHLRRRAVRVGQPRTLAGVSDPGWRPIRRSIRRGRAQSSR